MLQLQMQCWREFWALNFSICFILDLIRSVGQIATSSVTWLRIYVHTGALLCTGILKVCYSQALMVAKGSMLEAREFLKFPCGIVILLPSSNSIWILCDQLIDCPIIRTDLQIRTTFRFGWLGGFQETRCLDFQWRKKYIHTELLFLFMISLNLCFFLDFIINYFLMHCGEIYYLLIHSF